MRERKSCNALCVRRQFFPQTAGGRGTRQIRRIPVSTKSEEPWKKSAPKKSRHTTLTPESRAKARAAAKRAEGSIRISWTI